MSTDTAALRTGEIVAGRYRIDALVGQGGFGVVFRATQLPIGRAVALKMLLVEALAHGDGRARFRREAELAQRLEHPNTVRLYDFGETEAGLPFIAWEFLKGRPLDAVLATEGHLAPHRVARIATQTLKALMEAHGLGVVHRDIKPSNIYLCDFSGETDFVKVLDFGIAKNTLIRGMGLTPEGSILGTPSYMAPEQVRGGEIAPAADLYALGLVMAELLTGAPVFPGAVPLDVIMAQLADLPVPLAPAVVDSALGSVVARATQKRVEDRFGSAAEMLLALECANAASAAMPASTALPTPIATESSAQARAGAPTELGAIAAPAPAPSPKAALAETAYATMPRKPDLPPTLQGEAVTGAAPASVATLDPPPPEVAAAIEVPKLGPSTGSRSTMPLVLALGFLVVVCAAAGVFVARRHAAAETVPVASTAPTHPSATRSAPTIPSMPAPPPPLPPTPAPRHFASLTNKQIRARIEAGGHHVTEEHTADNVTTFQLGSAAQAVRVVRMADARLAEQLEQSYLKAAVVTARDGPCVVRVDLPHAASARALLEHITR